MLAAFIIKAFLQKTQKKKKSVVSTLLTGLLASLIGKPMINLDHLNGVTENPAGLTIQRKVSTHVLEAKQM